MIAFPTMLVNPAKKAGINVPLDIDNYESASFPHWHLYRCVQLGSPMPTMSSHFRNAEIVAKIPLDEVSQITFDKLGELGLEIGFSN